MKLMVILALTGCFLVESQGGIAQVRSRGDRGDQGMSIGANIGISHPILIYSTPYLEDIFCFI